MLLHKANRIRLTDFKSQPMRAFHMTWLAFFMCFFGWFGIAPLTPVIREEFGLSNSQVMDTVIASVAITVVARLLVGWLCDKYGPRRTYAWLLILGALPVAGIGLSTGFISFLVFRLLIGAIGASFVITQYHTTLMFAPNCVGTANATTAGWGNLGGGVVQFVMPPLMAGFLFLGASEADAWRYAMIVPAVAMVALGIAYYRVTRDTPDGDYKELRGHSAGLQHVGGKGAFWEAARDFRVWALFAVYAACFGVELQINNIIAMYFFDEFAVSLTMAGVIASLFGLMNLFARTMGGAIGDRAGIRFGLKGRVAFLGIALAAEGIALVAFSRMDALILAIVGLVVFSLFVQIAEGATFSVIPFVSKRALGSVAGIVGAGGNVGAVACGFLMRHEGITIRDGLLYMGIGVIVLSSTAWLVRFSERDEREARAELEEGLGPIAA